MTRDQPTALVEVTQGDKDRAVEIAHALGMSAEDFTSGAADVLVQHCARHRIAALEEAARLAEADTARLDFLDQMNAAKNEFHGTRYGWKYEVNHNRIALSDHNWPPLKVREAIDQARERHAAIRKAKEGSRG